MARLASILEQEYKTKGAFSGTSSALGKAALEKLDIRNALFGGGGVGSVIGTKVFGKGYSATRNKGTVKSTSPVSENLSSASSPILQQINANMKMTAKNSMSLPMMARDMNLTKLNIMKLVKASGEKPTHGHDRFWKNSKGRDTAYNNTIGKMMTGSGGESAIGGGLSGAGSGLESVVGGAAGGAAGGALSGLIRTVIGIAAPAAVMFAAARGLDFGLGKQGVGKDAEGKDLSVPELSDKTNLDRMTQLQKMQSGVARTIENIGDYVAPNMANQARSDRFKKENEFLNTNQKDQEEAVAKEKSHLDDYLKNQEKLKQQREEAAAQEKSHLDDYLKNQEKLKQQREEAAKKFSETKSPSPVASTPTTSPVASTPTTSTTPITTGPGGAAFGMYPTPGGKSPLLDMIAKGESAGAGGYNAMNQGTPGGGPVIGSGDSQKIINKKLTDMTVGEVLDKGAQPNDDAKKRMENGLIFAAGRYQIIPKTLEALVKQGVVSKDDKFDETTQDKLGMALIKGTGALKLAAAGNYEEAQNALAKTWASIPLATDIGNKKAGQSYYQKPGQNTAHSSLDVRGALMASGSALSLASTSVSDQKMAAMIPTGQTTVINNSPTTLASNSPSGSNATPYQREFYSNMVNNIAL